MCTWRYWYEMHGTVSIHIHILFLGLTLNSNYAVYWFRIFIHWTDCRTEINRKQKPQQQQEAITGNSHQLKVHLVMETWCQGSTQDKILIRIKMLCVGISGSQRGFRSSFDVWFSFLPVLDSGSSCGWHWHILPPVSVKPQSQTGPGNQLPATTE